MKHMMVDLETLDTRPSTVVLSIGVVVFDEENIIDEGHWRLSWQGQIDDGRTVSESTIRWWLQQSDEARAALQVANPLELHQGLQRLFEMYRAHNCERLWANGPTFDISIIEHACGYLAQPWKYNAPRDMRTLRDLVPESIAASIPVLTAHNALDDAIWQARFVQAALKHLRR